MADTSPMTAAEIRQSFLDFFREKQHTIVPSSSLLPDAPNLQFTNAGMNQFVPIFLGNAPCPYDPARAADTQKCIRAGGKHNDLEDVGYDTYHQTFFEMLGNWSFGDYFKQEAIAWAWELVVERWGFPPERLYATVYRPGEGDPAETDDEAYAFWSEIFTKAGLDPAVHIVYGGKKDNFWSMGDTGPCGPCSELHVNLLPPDQLDPKANRDLVNADDPRLIEIWNLVFIQFNSDGEGNYPPLPAKHVDTGMGFERVTSIIQGTKGFTDFSQVGRISNYNTDLFAPLFEALEAKTGKTYTGTLPPASGTPSEQEKTDIAFRVIADHVRCLAFAIGDGIMPSNVGRGYTLRRILRRGVKYVHGLGYHQPFLCELVDVLAREMGGMFPELKEKKQLIQDTIRGEEESFHRTLDRGMQLFEEVLKNLEIDSEIRSAPVPGAVPGVSPGTGNTPVGSKYIKRRLPHFERPWATYSVTFSTKGRKPLSEHARELVLRAILHFDKERYELFAACVMPDHSHLLLQPMPKNRDEQDAPEFWSLGEITHSIKSYTAKQINEAAGEEGSVWEKECFDRVIRSEKDLEEVFLYICRNPWRDGVVDNDRDYPWLWTPDRAPRQDAGESPQDAGAPVPTAGGTPEAAAGDDGPPHQKKTFPGDEAFKLYDTYGFPLDLTQLLARERGLDVDVATFEKLMEEQQQRGKESQKKTVITVDTGALGAEASEFVGYDQLESEATVSAVQDGVLIVDKTPFYAEMGGQVGDRGSVEINGRQFQIVDTQKSPEGAFLHQLEDAAKQEVVEAGAGADLSVSRPRRARIEAHHSVTHIMHWALRQVLGEQVTQKGSYVGPDRLRFDFSHNKAMTPEEIAEVERLVNEHIAARESVRWEERAYADVQKDPNIIQFFGDKYGDVVRVVTIGDGYSSELCGGTTSATRSRSATSNY